MKVTILDTLTGETRESAGICTFQWCDNNWSCDCNRRYSFKPHHEWDDGEREGFCIGCQRFIVTAAEVELENDWQATLAEMNSGYPLDLLVKHGIVVP